MKNALSSSLRILCLILTLFMILSTVACTTTSQPSDTTAPTAKATQAATAAPTAESTAEAPQWPTDPNLNTPGTLPICKETVTLSVGVAQSAVIENWETNLQTLAIEEQGNFDLSFVEFPSDSKEFIQKVELMVMAGGAELPDVIMSDLGGQANLVKYGQAGMIIATNDYYENLTFNIDLSCQNTVKSKEELLTYVTAYDGNVYGVFRLMESLNNEYSGARIIIYEPWLTALDLEMPQTTDEFVEVLKAFRDNDPNGNGQADEIPLLGYKDVMTANYAYAMMTPFVYTQSNYWTYEDGEIGVAFTTDGWREGLRYTKMLIDEGLLDPLSFTQDSAQMTAIISPDPATVGAYVRYSTSNLGAQDTKRGEYIIVPPLEGPTGRREQVWSPSLPGIGMVITKNCASPEAAFMMGDLMCGEELSIWTRWGREGEEWENPADGDKSVYDDVGYPAIIKVTSTAWGTMQNIWWGQIGPYIVDLLYPAGQVATGSPFDHNAPIGRSIGPAIEYANRNPIVGIVYNEQEQEVMTELHSTILTYVKESFTRFAMGDLSLDSDWDSYLAEFDKMGLEDVIAATQSAYDRMHSN